MKLRLHLPAAALLLGTSGCIFGWGGKKQQPEIRPVGNDKAAMLPVDHSSQFDRVREPKIGADTWFAAGQLQEAQGNLKAAIAQYERVLGVNDEHHGALYRLGVLYATTRDYGQAIAVWKRYILASHHSAVGYSNLGFCHELAGDPAAAERAYTTGIERDSDSGPCRVNYGLMLARHGRVDDAVAQMQLVLSPAEVHFNLGSVHEGTGRRELARMEYLKALDLDPTLKDAALRLQGLDSVTAVNPAE
jgi:tetratricopeptide (TPR) repeat protein